ncbi:hypothetical protein QJ043_09400 [Olsenella sp. YH-ols2217]|uniref:TrkA family protein n=1 Tax=Kribbibacterium absianum TaxID=3044210 RepID=A0ABT6ZML3_9ACTN|nr:MULTISPECIES: hypothetical protein [unclassified Olsenella]MDJ1122296.1 hypothetical protein [Olsenella sp. YH-ols2216]MDJ1130290.1 hypothetical protein [Olsenella sp. YH-ols2217]
MLNGLATMMQVADKGRTLSATAEADATAAIDTSRQMSERLAEVSATDPLAAVCFLIGVGCVVAIILSVASDRFKSQVKWLGTMAGKFAMILLGGFFLLLPIAMHTTAGSGYLWPKLGESVPAAAYLMFETMGFSADLSDWTVTIHTIMGNGALAELYFWLLAFYTVASPVALALTAMDVLMNGLTGFMVYFESWKKCVRRRDIYVFYGLDDNTSTLALDLLGQVADKSSDNPRDRMPLLIFCNVEGSTGEGDSLVQQVRQDAYGCATVIFTPMPLENIPNRLAPPTQTRCNVYYLVLSDDTDENVQATIRLCDQLTTQMMVWEMIGRRWDVRNIEPKPQLRPRTEAYARNVRVWCVHDNPDDDLIFDSLPQRKPDDQLMVHLLRHNADRGSADKRRPHIETALQPLMVVVRNLVEVRLISEQREVVWDTLTTNPLTQVLDPVDVSQDIVPFQRLVVVICGLGSFGLEALRACFWFGRLPGVELRIVGVDRRARDVAQHMAAAWPELVFERVPEGMPSVRPDLERPLTDASGSDAVPTVCFMEADARSLAMHDLLDGTPVQGFSIGPEGEEPETIVVGDSSRIYVMVMLGADDLSLDAALRLERTLSRRALAGRLSAGSPPAQNPLVSVLVRNQEVLESVRDVTHGDEQFSLRPFGSTQEAFSYERILGAPWEDAAINLQAAYTQARRVAQGLDPQVTHAEAMEAFNSYEIKKLSNRAATRFTPYRLWCVGLEANGGFPSEEAAAQWADKLGTQALAVSLTGRDETAVRLLCGIDFPDRGLSQEDRDKRVALLRSVEEAEAKEYPVVCSLGDLEHARWCAFLRAQGWSAVDGGFDALERMVSFVGLQDDPARPYPHESMRLMRHYYLVDDPAAYRMRGAECRGDPAAYDRAIVTQAVRAMRREVIEPEYGRHPHLHRLEGMGRKRTRRRG